MHVFEHAPGKFALGTFPDVYTEYEKSESTLLESVTLVYWLLREHRCVTRLDLGDAAVLFCNFPALLCTALRQNKGLEEVRLHPKDVRGKLSLALDALDINELTPTIVSLGGIAEANDVLREVSLSDNSIGDLGAGALAKALLKNSTLKRLDISECMCSYDGLSSFLKSLSLNTTVECIRLGDIDVPESWSPSSPLDASVCARLDVTWNTRGLQDWASSLRQGGEHHFPRLCVGWTKDTASSGIVEWFDAVRAIGASITELVISCPEGVGQECGDAAASFLETTCSLKKLTVNVKDRCCSFVNAIIRGLARNKSVSEAKFLECYLIDQLTKALQDLMRTNRTLHRLEFKAVYLKERAVRSLARALEDNFVLLTFDLEYTPDVGMHLIFSVLDRNRSLLSRAVECVLNASAEEESIRALQLLSLTDSLIDAVVEVSGKDREECRILVQESVRRL
ncbi:hypothetical protein HPB52_009487 [Rhipicephalus sanguineus]|uniref:Uncharacterized protein n=1 Tax=Rhipicephalus sanguineus TaxID=34632 RepID=A0A9D4QE74_RHISA|nr:hypothetical protein HPB52_009487 [Rhipicephalus sanguineus]